MIDKPAIFCRDGMSELWDNLSAYVDFIELFGVSTLEDCETETFPTNDEVEDAGCVMMCQIVYLSPIGRCIIPISANSFIEVDCGS
jgi:hypothetical protein